MIDESLKENEALGKNIGNNLKSYIKEQNSLYVPLVKNKIEEGLREYYSKLNETIQNELLSYEKIQTNLNNQIDSTKDDTEKLKLKQKRHRDLLLRLKLQRNEIKLKSNIFSFFKDNYEQEKREKKLDSQIIYSRIHRMKRNIFELLKKTTTFKPIKEYDNQIKTIVNNDLNKYREVQKNEKEELLRLIYQAEEKLKHENRKKIQTKLLLDQIVLRGVSAMNIKALSLSNDSLKGKKFIIKDVYKSEYIKEIEKTFHSFNLPKTKETLITKLEVNK